MRKKAMEMEMGIEVNRNPYATRCGHGRGAVRHSCRIFVCKLYSIQAKSEHPSITLQTK